MGRLAHPVRPGDVGMRRCDTVSVRVSAILDERRRVKNLTIRALADRADGAAQLHSPFLGRPAPVPLGPHVLAARAGGAA